MINLTEEALYIWMAGFVDGEGTISIVSVGKSRQFIAKISVSNTNKNSIDLFVKEFGGKIRLRIWHGEGKKKWKPCYEWSLTNIAAINAIKKIRKYLMIKGEQADLVLELGRLKSTYAPVELRWNKDLKEQMFLNFTVLKDKIRILNKRGL